QAMPSGGKLTLEVTGESDGKDGRTSAHPQADVRVSDSGHGMEPQTLGRIWEPFSTTKSKGTGLCLSIVRNIIEQHERKVTVRSTPGAGTTFEFRIQLTQKQDALSMGPKEANGQRSQTLLLAEDDPDVREALATYLREAGYGVLEAEDGV